MDAIGILHKANQSACFYIKLFSITLYWKDRKIYKEDTFIYSVKHPLKYSLRTFTPTVYDRKMDI